MCNYIKDNARELKQLTIAANYYWKLSKETWFKVEKNELEKTILEVADEASKLQEPLPYWYILNMHLGSCAVRIENIESILNSNYYKNYQEFLKLNNEEEMEKKFNSIKENIIPILFRHKLAHPERKNKSQKSFEFLMKKWFHFTIEEIYFGIEKSLGRINSES